MFIVVEQDEADICDRKKKIGVEKSLKYNTVISILNTIEREND